MMKNYAVPVSMLLCALITGFDVSFENRSAKERQHDKGREELFNSAHEKQAGIHQNVKAVPKNQIIETRTGIDIKSPPSAIDKHSVSVNGASTEQQQTLDLSLPVETQTAEISKAKGNKVKDHILPELLTDKKTGKNKTLQVDGKLIKREEEAVGKDRVVDGVGIDIKLHP